MELMKIWTSLTEGWQLKLFLASGFTLLFGGYNAAMGALAILVVVDLVTKIWALSKGAGGFFFACNGGIITSRGLRDGIPKIFGYILLLIAAHQLNQFVILNYVLGETPKEILSAYLALIEIKSILENLRDTGMKDLDGFIGILGEKQNQIVSKK